MTLLESIIRLYLILCIFIGYFHYFLIKNIYKVQELEFGLLYGMGMGLGMVIGGLSNIFFRIPELIIYVFEEKSNIFAVFLTFVLSIISCFGLSFSTYYLTSLFSYKIVPSNYYFLDYNGFVLSMGFYPIFIIIYFFLDLGYYYNHYGIKYLIFTSNTQINETNDSFIQIISFLINIISVCICLYIGNICSWFYMIQNDKKTFIKCILYPSLITTIPFFSFILYKIGFNFLIVIILGIIGISLSIVWRITIFQEYHKQYSLITLSKEEEDDLVEYIDDRICFEKFSEYEKIKIPISFSGIIFGNK